MTWKAEENSSIAWTNTKAKNTRILIILENYKIEKKIAAVENTEMEDYNSNYQIKVKPERVMDQIY